MSSFIEWPFRLLEQAVAWMVAAAMAGLRRQSERAVSHALSQVERLVRR